MIFLGDYLDRGECSLPVLIGVLLLKQLYPNNIVILRGNHEAETVYREVFFGELGKRLDLGDDEEGFWDCYNKIFELCEQLPLIALNRLGLIAAQIKVVGITSHFSCSKFASASID